MFKKKNEEVKQETDIEYKKDLYEISQDEFIKNKEYILKNFLSFIFENHINQKITQRKNIKIQNFGIFHLIK